jgi:hypothetical protein
MRLNSPSLEVGALVLLLTLGTPALAQEAFLRPTTSAGTLPEDKSPTVVRAINVVADVGQLNPNNRSLRMIAFDRTFELELDRIEPIPGRGLIWYGRIVKEPESSVIFTVVGGILSGNVDTQAGKVYQVRYAGGGVYSFREIDRTKFPDEGEPRRPSPAPPPAPPPPPTPSCADAPKDIDLLVVYTPAARIAVGGQDAMEGLVYLAVAEANQSYLNSEIVQRLRLVHVEEVSYAESNSHDIDLDRLENGTDGFMDNVQTLRDTFAADLVSLITEYPPSAGLSCGLGNVMAAGFVDHSFESLAFSVVKRDCAAGSFSLAHETGHNMGAYHVSGNGAYSYSHAFVKLTPTVPSVGRWRTVMAEQTFPVASARVRYFSNPNVNYPAVGGDATGVAGSADNALTLNTNALIVANFRCSSPGAPNVWMQDTWDDTGLEPDFHTAGEDMWKSPYIWVRTTQDTDLVHQHEHENPIVGAPNWVYVKLQNGGSTAASGNLEVYWANASTSLAWPGAWTLLSSVPVAGFAAKSTKVVEMPWSSLPGAGHYCLVARWNSAADPMAVAEGRDIDANVRANNNLVWRNLHIVDLMLGASAEAALNVMNPDPESKEISIVVRSPSIRGQSSFLAAGQVLVEFDETLLKAWQEGGARGSGFTVEGNRFIIRDGGATFENLVLPYQRGGRLKLIFRRLPATPKREYLVDVVQRRPAQFAAAQKLSAVVGGVSYQVHTDRDHLRR